MTNPILYILMRNDLASMNPGKAIAQGSHAASAFANKLPQCVIGSDCDIWKSSTSQGFGTVLVLAVTGSELEQAIKTAQDLGFISEIIYDPTYPIQDGLVTHYIPLNTCGYIFGDKDRLKLAEIVSGYKLHP